MTPGAYTIFPATTVADLSASLFAVVGDNVAIVLGVVGVAIGVRFIMRWFGKSTSKLKA